MSMRKIKKVGILSVALTFAAIYACISLLVIPLVWLGIALTMGELGQKNLPLQGMTTAGAFIATLFIPVVYAILGFIGGAIIGFVYNLVSKMTGGIEIELEPEPTVTMPGIQEQR
ncbi:MAG TPA: DUF3566 domain-containing protein [Candidatus Angelobacter sp.]|nr:DUF3566 domain-containing protein [Candidatus Angelobacter sp.]